MKYLVVKIEPCGLDHILALLKAAIKEAVILDRTLVITDAYMDDWHNFKKDLSIDFDNYINLDKTNVYKIDKNGMQKCPFNYIKADDFNLKSYADNQIIELEEEELLPTHNNYEVIIRNIESRAFTWQPRFAPYIVRFEPADKVNQITDQVLNAMGTSLSQVQELNSTFQGVDFSANRDIYATPMPTELPAYYACLHVRSVPYMQNLNHASKPKNICATLERVIPNGSKLYIMSDIKHPDYFNFLRKRYQTYQYHDFPILKQLVSGENSEPVDNAMLYSVEKNLLQYANRKIIPFRDDNYHNHIVYTGVLHNPLGWRILQRKNYIVLELSIKFGKKYSLYKNRFKRILNASIYKLSRKRLQ